MFKNSSVRPGYLEVFCGPMKSGKSRELINRLERIKYVVACQSILLKPSIDTRDSTVKSRNGTNISECIKIEPNQVDEIIDLAFGKQVVGIDEFHLFNQKIVPVIEKLLRNNHNIIIGGLDLDFRGEPFGPMPDILALADQVTKLVAVCQATGCNNDATRTQRLVNGKPAPYDAPLILIGDGAEGYEARCLKHHICSK